MKRLVSILMAMILAFTICASASADGQMSIGHDAAVKAKENAELLLDLYKFYPDDFGTYMLNLSYQYVVMAVTATGAWNAEMLFVQYGMETSDMEAMDFTRTMVNTMILRQCAENHTSWMNKEMSNIEFGDFLVKLIESLKIDE